jgi:hypothetical protein
MANTTDLDTLAESYRHATGCTVEEAADVLHEVGDYFEAEPDVLPHFVARVATRSGLPPARVVRWLHDRSASSSWCRAWTNGSSPPGCARACTPSAARGN